MSKVNSGTDVPGSELSHGLVPPRCRGAALAVCGGDHKREY